MIEEPEDPNLVAIVGALAVPEKPELLLLAERSLVAAQDRRAEIQRALNDAIEAAELRRLRGSAPAPMAALQLENALAAADENIRAASAALSDVRSTLKLDIDATVDQIGAGFTAAILERLIEIESLLKAAADLDHFVRNNGMAPPGAVKGARDALRHLAYFRRALELK